MRKHLLWLTVLLVSICNFARAEELPVATLLHALPASGAALQTAPTSHDLLRTTPLTDGAETFWREKIYTILRRHYHQTAEEPTYLRRDIAQMAEYFARYTDVRDLFRDLDGGRWQWQYGQQQAETQVLGTRLQVRSVTVYFDSRAGAQFQFRDACATKVPYCFTAPADVFLHELLHVRAILVNPDRFIAQGGMAEHLYPHAHEQQTIAAERQLYAAMSRQDAIPRPIRSSHTGRHTRTHCVTCLQ